MRLGGWLIGGALVLAAMVFALWLGPGDGARHAAPALRTVAAPDPDLPPATYLGRTAAEWTAEMVALEERRSRIGPDGPCVHGREQCEALVALRATDEIRTEIVPRLLDGVRTGQFDVAVSAAGCLATLGRFAETALPALKRLPASGDGMVDHSVAFAIQSIEEDLARAGSD